MRALLAFTRPVARDTAAAYLSAAEMELFETMRRSEQLHSLNVLRDVLAQGSAPHDLAVAALLHDAGKTRYPFPVWEKTLVVLVRAAAPRLYARWAAGNPERWWQRPFVVSARHPAWSADMAAAAGSAPRAVWLIAHHAEPETVWADHPHAPLLRRLRGADDTN